MIQKRIQTLKAMYKKITTLQDYLEAEALADELYDDVDKEPQLLEVIERMTEYEELNPDRVTDIFSDETNLQYEGCELDNQEDYSDYLDMCPHSADLSY